MTFSDIFKNSFLEQYQAEATWTYVLTVLGATAAMAFYIYFAYRLFCKKSFYSADFNLSLPLMSIITCAIILTIQYSVVVSLGMVGALSIVRFRTAVKNPMDLVFLFWAISVGIICGAGLPLIGVVVCVVVSVVLLVLGKMPLVNTSMLLVVNTADTDAYDSITRTVSRYVKRYRVRSKTYTGDSLDLVLELRIAANSKLTKELSSLQGMNSVALITYDGDPV